MKLGYEFYHRPCLEVARDLVGKILVHRTSGGELRLRITETEAYCGADDTACHAHKGRTGRTEVLYADAGTVYVYLCYGVHNLMNVITMQSTVLSTLWTMLICTSRSLQLFHLVCLNLQAH